MEDDLRRAMMLPATPTFPFSEDDEPDSLEYDPTTSLSAEMHELNLNFPPPELVAEVAAEVASPTGGGSISEVLRVGLFPLAAIANHSCDPNVLAVTTNMQARTYMPCIIHTIFYFDGPFQRDLGFTRAEAAYLRQPVNVSDAFHTHLARLKQTSLLDDVVVYVALHPIEIGTEITASYHRVNRSRDCTCGAPCCRRTF